MFRQTDNMAIHMFYTVPHWKVGLSINYDMHEPAGIHKAYIVNRAS